MAKAELKISGMSCGHCVGAVRRALEEVDGVGVEEVRVGAARLSYDAGRVSPERIADAVRDQGYAVEEIGGAS